MKNSKKSFIPKWPGLLAKTNAQINRQNEALVAIIVKYYFNVLFHGMLSCHLGSQWISLNHIPVIQFYFSQFLHLGTQLMQIMVELFAFEVRMNGQNMNSLSFCENKYYTNTNNCTQYLGNVSWKWSQFSLNLSTMLLEEKVAGNIVHDIR